MGINADKYRNRYIKRAARVLPAIQPGVPFTPETIDQIVGGEYSSKFVFYLRELGFEFSQNKDGRKIVSYTLIKEPADAAAIRSATASTARGAAKAATPKAPKTPKVKAAKVAAKPAKAAPTGKALADIKAKNLAKLKEVGAARAKAAKRVREYDDVTEQFGTSGEVGTSFNVDRDWDSIEGVDLSKLIG
jgi:hypothetical protein